MVEPDGTPISGGCHKEQGDANSHAAAINISTHVKDRNGVLVFKDHNDRWNWLGIVSNNRMDREDDTLTTQSHKAFVQAIDNGTYSEAFKKDTPDLWIWHVPVPVGYSEMVAYDERGFLISAGKGYEGQFYDDIFEGLAKAETANPGAIGMSHGMPWDFIEKDGGDDHLINFYMSEEFTFLPKEMAANLGTGMGAVMLKDTAMPLQIDEHKRDWFIDTFGERVISQFDQYLGDMESAADEAGIPKKELDMARSKKKAEDVVSEALEDEVAESVDEDAAEDQDVKADDEDEEEEDDKAVHDDEDEDEDEDKQYVTTADLTATVKEIVAGVAGPVQALQTQITEMRKDVNDMRGELDTFKQTEDARVTEKATSTPAASLSAIIARTIVGNDKAQLDYNKDRDLRTAAPDESEAGAHVLGAGMTGIPSIDALIKEQRSGNRVSPAFTNGQ